MAQIKASIKSIRKDIKITAANASVKSEIRTAVKKTIAAAGTEQETESLRSAISVIDSAERKGIIHKNNAARKKSRLNARIKAQKA